jgi:RNA polymerase sigma-70 factor (ECF subfamily)
MTGSRPAAAQDSPEELVRRAAKRDTAAFARLVRLHNEEMTRVAFVIVGTSATAALATEAAWLSAWPGLRRTRRPEALGSWLCSLAAAEAAGLASRRDAHTPPVPDLDGRPTERPADSAVDQALAIALDRLDPEDRALLALRHVAGLSMAEVSQAVRRSRTPVDVRLAGLAVDISGPVPSRSDPVDIDRVLGQRLRAFADVPVRHVDADAMARRARAEESLERTRVVSVAIGAVAGVLFAAHPYLAQLLLGN